MKLKITFSFFVAILLISLYSLFTFAFADDSVQHTNFPSSITSKTGDKSYTLQFNDVENFFYDTVAGTTCDNAIILSYSVTNTAKQPGFCYQGYFVKINKSDGVTIKNISAARAGHGLIETDSYYIFSLENLGYSDCILDGSNITETDSMYVIDAKGQVNSQNSAMTLALHKLEKISNGQSDSDVTCNIQTIDCPTDADVNLYNFLSYNEAKKYKDVKPCIDAEYIFYPSEVAGKTLSINQTLNFKEKVGVNMSFSESISHPLYSLFNDVQTIYYSYTKDYSFDIPSDYQSLPSNYTDYNDSSIKHSVYYVPDTNKIYVRVSVLRKDIEDDYHKYLKNFKNWSDDDPNKKLFKYGYPFCDDDNSPDDVGNHAGKYKHIGDPCRSDKHHTLDSTCQLHSDSASSDYFHFYSNLDSDEHLKVSDTSTYVDSNGDKHTKDGNASIRFLDSEPAGGTNGYIDSHYTDSDKDIIYNTRDDFNLDSDNKVKDPSFSDSVNTLKNLLKSLKDFPQFFADFFDFLPGSYALATLLMILITIMIVVGFVKLVL